MIAIRKKQTVFTEYLYMYYVTTTLDLFVQMDLDPRWMTSFHSPLQSTIQEDFVERLEGVG